MAQKKWQEDDNLVAARLILLVNDGDPNRGVPEDDAEYIRARNALGIDNKQLTARVNVIRSNMPGYVGTKSGNPMHADTIVHRVVGQMVASPGYVKTCGKAIMERLEGN
ncbi:hypothetical protein AWC00_16220 [Mycobacterium conspicuum]|nr:hypothetical protein AWC00_16220 [Mycobacterium conspicuum]